jgi:hypothetical protein
MMRYSVVLTLVVSAALVCPAWAGILFGRQAKANPAQRVPQLLATLRSDPDEDKREAAAQELRDFDPSAFPEIVSYLIEALRQDAKVSVRLEAAQSLARLRPISQSAGHALEEAASHDASMRVRLQARNLLLQYRLGGYRTKGKSEELPQAPTAAQGVRAAPGPQTAATPAPPARRNSSVVLPRETAPPPLAPPLPNTSAPVPLVPSRAPVLQTPPPAREEQGPDLTLPE